METTALNFTVPELDPNLYGTGKELGSGLDKVCFEALWVETGELLPYVLKRQHGGWDGIHRDGQTEEELMMQMRLLDEDEEEGEAARAALQSMAYIVGYWTEEDGTVWILQEAVDTNGETNAWDTPCGMLLDAGWRNGGTRPSTGQYVSCDWGIENYGRLLDMGRAALEVEGN